MSDQIPRSSRALGKIQILFLSGAPVRPSNPLDEDDCRCVWDCADDPTTACSLSGDPHVHPLAIGPGFGPCPAHPDAPGDL